MDSHALQVLCANRVFGGIAFIQRNPSFLMEKVEASCKVRLLITLKDTFFFLHKR